MKYYIVKCREAIHTVKSYLLNTKLDNPNIIFQVEIDLPEGSPTGELFYDHFDSTLHIGEESIYASGGGSFGAILNPNDENRNLFNKVYRTYFDAEERIEDDNFYGFISGRHIQTWK